VAKGGPWGPSREPPNPEPAHQGGHWHLLRNYSTYCELGINLRAYAMASLNVRRLAYVGCSLCAHVRVGFAGSSWKAARRAKSGREFR